MSPLNSVTRLPVNNELTSPVKNPKESGHLAEKAWSLSESGKALIVDGLSFIYRNEYINCAKTCDNFYKKSLAETEYLFKLYCDVVEPNTTEALDKWDVFRAPVENNARECITSCTARNTMLAIGLLCGLAFGLNALFNRIDKTEEQAPSPSKNLEFAAANQKV